jgi:hypothetical protein
VNKSIEGVRKGMKEPLANNYINFLHAFSFFYHIYIYIYVGIAFWKEKIDFGYCLSYLVGVAKKREKKLK